MPLGFCPILLAATYLTNYPSVHTSHCLGVECQWWTRDNCAIIALAGMERSLAMIANQTGRVP